MRCTVCKYEGHPVQDLTTVVVPETGAPTTVLQDVCPRCKEPIWSAQAPDAHAASESHKALQAAPRALRKTSGERKPREPKDALTRTRERLAVVERKLAAMRGLEAEAAMLRRMIVAAEGEQPIKQPNGFCNPPNWTA